MNLLRTSIIGGICLSSLHFFWVILLAIGWAQPLMDFIFKLHMLNSPFQVQVFNPLLALGLLGATFLIGCFYGALFYFIRRQFIK
ncbi:hypothetical protein [Polynucleobacter sinensis]|jgi:hypothetical protein|uniref:hypothetical protein n=1 Tax=Polynucleobacter sinensis TaxID=1743157 RepID=UPI0007858071|nr:hypothetical protein [Polynucleobacter sinensis]